MPPSDEEMIRHFATHEAAFRKVYEIMAESSEGSFHYPPLSPEEVIILDSTEQSDTFHETNDEQDIPVYGLLKPERILLDSLPYPHFHSPSMRQNEGLRKRLVRAFPCEEETGKVRILSGNVPAAETRYGKKRASPVEKRAPLPCRCLPNSG